MGQSFPSRDRQAEFQLRGAHFTYLSQLRRCPQEESLRKDPENGWRSSKFSKPRRGGYMEAGRENKEAGQCKSIYRYGAKRGPRLTEQCKIL